MSLIAASLFFAALPATDVDRNALRTQARMPSIQVSWNFTTSKSIEALRKLQLKPLLALKRPTAEQLYKIAALEEHLVADAKPYYLRAIARLEKEKPKTVVGQSDLALAYMKAGRKTAALALAERLKERYPSRWLAWSTYGAVKAQSLEGSYGNLNLGDTSSVIARLKTDSKLRAEVQRLKDLNADAKAALDKGVELGPLEPDAYRMRKDAGMTGFTSNAFAALLDAENADTSQNPLLAFFQGPLDDTRRVALLTKDPADQIEYVLGGVMVAGMKYGSEHQDQQAEGKVPQVAEGSEKTEYLAMLDGAIAQTARLAPAQHAAILKDVAFCYLFLGEAKRGADAASRAAKGLPNDADAARQHLDILIVSDQFADALGPAAGYAAAHPEWRDVGYRAAKIMEHENRLEPALKIVVRQRAQNPKDARAILADAALRLRLPGYANELPAISDELKLLDALKLDDKDLRTEASFLRAVCLGLAGKTNEAKELLDAIDTSDDSKLADRVAAAEKALG